MIPPEPIDEGDEPAPRPSRSARKRAAEHLQRLGVRLLALPESRLHSLTLPEALLEALREARRVRGPGAIARQHQYIGRLMRELDPAPIEQALEQAAGQGSTRGKMRR